MEERIELHVQYVERWSLWLDLVVLLRCIPVILRRRDTDELASSAA
jgi:lipopolysaccharide/colanic/teichoic acid biosynthesis glycosyltransferase